MEKSSLTCALALLLFVCVSVCAQTGGSHETITIDPNAAAHDFPHFWEQMFGSGRAVLSLRQDYRLDLRKVKDITEFEFIRFHAILDDDIGVYDEDSKSNPIYNFSYVDQIYDGLLESGVRPFVELSFMPRKLAANLTPHPFWYKPLPSPPNDPGKWQALIETFVAHLENRYGKSEVQKWYFEVWNEPNIDFWDGVPKQRTYFALYDQTAKAVKAVDPKLRVGGPATAQAAWVAAFIEHCTKNNIPFDFVSTHVYGNDTSQDVFGRKEDIPRRDMVARAAHKIYDQVKNSAAPKTPIIWSEYNATYMNQPEVTDSAFMGPWLANNIRESDGLADMMSYWCFSDVFEEQGIVKKPFYGGYGLIAERSIPKAAFRAFELLHQLGDRRFENSSENALVTQRDDGTYEIALWNYAEPGETVPSKTFHLDIKGPHAKDYRIRFVGPGNGSAWEAWKQMGSPSYPTVTQIRQLVKASELKPIQTSPVEQDIILGPQTLAVLEIAKGH